MKESVAHDRGLPVWQTGVVSELLTVGPPDETSPLLIFKTVGIPRHPRVSSWPRCTLLEARALGMTGAQLKEAIWDCRKLVREWECHCLSSVYHSAILFHLLQMIWGIFSLRRILMTVHFGDRRPGVGSYGRLAENIIETYLRRYSGDIAE